MTVTDRIIGSTIILGLVVAEFSERIARDVDCASGTNESASYDNRGLQVSPFMSLIDLALDVSMIVFSERLCWG